MYLFHSAASLTTVFQLRVVTLFPYSLLIEFIKSVVFLDGLSVMILQISCSVTNTTLYPPSADSNGASLACFCFCAKKVTYNRVSGVSVIPLNGFLCTKSTISC